MARGQSVGIGSIVKLQLVGIRVPCIRCLERPAKFIILNFPLCEECAEKKDK
jgi:hypothetical protein